MSKSRDIADSAATINYIDGLTSDAQGQLNDKATLDGSPTFTGTVTATAFSGDGSGLTGVDSLPSQTGNNGLFLTTDGSTASWAAAGGGAWELLNTYTASSDAQVEINDFSSTYDDYVILIDSLSTQYDQVQLRLQLELNGSYQTSNYSYMMLFNAVSASSTNSDYIQILRDVTSTPTASNYSYSSCMILIPNVNKNIKPTIYSNGRNLYSQASSVFEVAGHHKTLNNYITALKFYSNGGNIVTGTFKIYGIAKA